MHYCVPAAAFGGALVSATLVNGAGTIATDLSLPTAGGCSDIPVPTPDTSGGQHLLIKVADTDGGTVSTVTLNDVRTTWMAV